MSLTLNDLRVVDNPGARGSYTASTSAATLADLVEVLKQEGAETIGWCEVHEATAATYRLGQFCRFVDGHMIGHRSFIPPPTSCRMVECLVLPLDGTPK